MRVACEKLTGRARELASGWSRGTLGLVVAFLGFAASSSAQPLAPGAFQFTSASYTYSESDPVARVTVTRVKGWDGKMSVDLIVSNDTATNGTHFKIAATNKLIFNDFQSSAFLDIPLEQDFTTNANRRFKVSLTNFVAAPGENPALVGTNGAPREATVTILDDDTPMAFNLGGTHFTVREGGVLEIPIRLPQAPGDGAQNVSANYVIGVNTSTPLKAGSTYATEGADATAGDFIGTSGGQVTATFANDQSEATIVIPINLDDLIEFNEDFHVEIVSVQGSITQEDPATDGGTDAGTDGGTDAGTDGGTDGGGTTTTEIPFVLGNVNKATVTILFNGTPAHPAPSGAVDQNFNVDNDPATTPPNNTNPGANNTVFAVAVQPDGKTLIGGTFTAVNATIRNRIARLNPDGQVDTTFNPIGGANDYVSTISLIETGPNAGNILIGGGFSSVNGVLRNGIALLNPDGSVNLGFDPGLGTDGPVYSIVAQLDGTILIGGEFSSYNGFPRRRLARLTATGQLDLNFATAGGPDDAVYAIYSESAPLLLFSESGLGTSTNEVSFPYNISSRRGRMFLDTMFYNETNVIQVFAGNQLLAQVGPRTNAATLVTNQLGEVTTVYTWNTIEFPYGPNAEPNIRVVVNPGTQFESDNWDFFLLVQPGESLGVMVGGEFATFDGIEVGNIARLLPDGSFDAGFSSGIGADGPIYSIARQGTGKILVAGAFQTFNSAPARSLVRLNVDGSYDNTFALGSGFNSQVSAISVDANDNILAAGRFTRVNEARRIFAARLLPDGQLDTSFLDTAFNQFSGFPNPQGFAPVGFLNAIVEDNDGNVLVGGSFTRVGGGGTRAAAKPRSNIARLVGGTTQDLAPGNLEWSSKSFGVDENGGVLGASINRLNGSLGQIAITAQTTDSVALAGLDYTGVTNKVVWVSSATAPESGAVGSQSFAVSILDDDLIEGTESFLLAIFNPIGELTLGGEYIPTIPGLGSLSQSKGLIIENDTQPSLVGFQKAEYEVEENGANITITVVRSGNSSSSVSVGYESYVKGDPNEATIVADYTAVSGNLNFSSGQTTRTFTLRVRDDAIVEQDEFVFLRLVNPSPGLTLDTNMTSSVVTIVDNDYAPGRVSFAATNYVANENGEVVVSVIRRGGNVGVITAKYATEDMEATSPADYLATTGTLQWNDRDASVKTFTIPIRPDGLVEGPERIKLVLFGATPSPALGLRTNSFVTITDDDFFGEFQFSAAAYVADEIGTNAVITVVRRNGSAETATVDYAATNLTAIVGKDFAKVSGTLTFNVGEKSKTFVVPVFDDLDADGEVTVGLSLSNPTPAGAVLGPIKEAILYIVDNESFNIPAGGNQTDFGMGLGADGNINAIKLLPSGKILVAGEFKIFDRRVRTYFARLNADGSLDTTFGPDYNIAGKINDFAISLNQDALIVGEFTNVDGLPFNRIAKINSGGALELTFSPGSGADNPIFAIERVIVDKLPKFIIGGSFSIYDGLKRGGLARIQEDGRVDKSFNPGSGVNGIIYDIGVQSDGKIIVVGEFDLASGLSRKNVARYNTDGSIDPTFDPGSGPDQTIRTVTVQYDDRIVIGGLFTTFSGVSTPRAARLNSDGSLDSTFNVGSGANAAIYASAQQADGKILLGGDFTLYKGVASGRVIRLEEDGDIDPSINFGTGADKFVNSIAVQPDRLLLVGGGFGKFDGLDRNKLARIYGGSLAGPGELEFTAPFFSISETATNAVIGIKRSFGLSGEVSVQFTARESLELNAATAELDFAPVSQTLIFQPGENLKLVGIPIFDDSLPEAVEIVDLSLSNPAGGAILGRQPVAQLRILSDDTLVGFADPVYAVSENVAGGRATIVVSRQGELSLPLSVFYVTSSGTAAANVDYVPAAGILNFAPGESQVTFSVQILDDTLVEENESIILELSGPSAGGILARATAILTIVDNDFAPGTLNLGTVNSVPESAGSVAISVNRQGGKTGPVTVQYETLAGSAQPGLDYLSAAGTLTFLDGESAKSIVITILDDLLVEGNETFSVRIFNPGGGGVLGTRTTVTVGIVDDDFGPASLDSTFAVGSGAANPGGQAAAVNALRIQPDGKIIAVGNFATFNGSAVNHLVRLGTNGQRDLSFVSSGLNGVVSGLDLGAGGRIVVGGAFSAFGGAQRPFVGRFLTNGNVDSAFFKTAAENAPILAVAVQTDGKTVAGGSLTTPSRGLIRLTGDGALDVSFSTEGGLDGDALAVAALPGGKILVGGSFTKVGPANSRGLTRLLPSGLVDQTFKIGSGVAGVVRAILPLADGSILISGQFTSVNGVGRVNLAKLNPDGSVDTGFAFGSGPNGVVNAVAVSPAHVYLGGDFTTFSGSPRARIARLNLNGSLDTTFEPGIGPNGTVNSIAVQSDGKVVIGGAFTSVNGLASPRVARLLGTPTVTVLDIVITSITYNIASGIGITFESQNGVGYSIEASSDLANWQVVGTVAATGPSATYQEVISGGIAQRYYRVKRN